MILLKDICKSYGGLEVLRDINLELRQGDFLTIFGPNGAGKTTLIKILANLIKPTKGEILFLGQPIKEQDTVYRNNIGVISHNTYLYNNLTPYENLVFYGRLYNVENLEKIVKEVIEQVGLKDRMNDPVRTFSRGMQQRLAIARILIHKPNIIFLDEPYTGLDQHAVRMLRDILSKIQDGKKIIIMITHNLQHGLEMCTRVVIQVKGRMLFNKDIKEINKTSFEEIYLNYVNNK